MKKLLSMVIGMGTLFMLFPSAFWATAATSPQITVSNQSGSVKGTVSDENGEPLIGATITVKGTNVSVITDVNGNFVIKAHVGQTLTIHSLGYDDKEVKVEQNIPMDIVLTDNATILEDVVVIGYGTTKKKDLTGSVASVKAADLNTVSSSSVSQMLQGKVTGMSSIQNSAQPGAGISVNIRGAASPSGSNAPLYVIDGVPIQTNSTADPGLTTKNYDLKTGVDRDPLASINPNDIESIDVLKDASAAAIYGASAANGVVLITTKTGKVGKPKVSLRSTYTAQIQKDYPEVMGARDFREQTNFWTREYYLYKNNMAPYGTNPADLSKYVPIFANVNDYSVDTDWMDEVTRNGYIVDENLTVTGGTEKTKYFLSYNFYDNVGLLKQSGFTRHSFRVNISQQFSTRLTGGVKVTYSNVTAESSSVGASGNGDNMILNALRFAPDIPVKDENGKYTRSYYKLINNPVSFTEFDDNTNTQRIFVNPTIDFKIYDKLVLHAVGGYDSQSSVRSFYLPVSAMNTTVPEGMAQKGYSKVENLSGELFINYDKTFNDDHRLSAVLGAGYYRTSDSGFGVTAMNFFTDAFGSDNIGIASDKNKAESRSWRKERTKLSQFLRVNYAFKDRYMFTFTARRDGSSYFAENHKWGIFPSVSAAWRINQEAFMRDVIAVSDLKLRIGYGSVGNENVLGTNSLSMYKSGFNYLIGDQMHTGLALTQIENPNLKWETNYTFNVGLDFGFLSQRFNGTIEYFNRGVKDLLDYQVLPSNNAVGRVAANIGETRSRGFEVSLNSKNVISPFVWETSLNVSYFKTNWVKRNPEVALAEYIGETDELDAIYGWVTDGIITSDADKPSYMPDAKPGNIRYVDLNKDGVLDIKDVTKIGNRTPRWMVGLGNTLSYKGFDLNFYFYGAFGYKKYRGQIPDAAIIGNYDTAARNTYTTIMTDVWNSQTGTGWMPGIATNVYDNANPSNNNDFHWLDGSYVKLKSITLGYTLPRSIYTANSCVKDIRLFIDAQNVCTFTNYKGFDPELATDNPYPQALSLSFGVNIDF